MIKNLKKIQMKILLSFWSASGKHVHVMYTPLNPTFI